MLDQPSVSLSPASHLSSRSENSQATLDAFFAVGGLTVYASSSPSWRWRACASGKSLEAVLIDPQSLIENAASSETFSKPAANFRGKHKPFEHHTLVRWLTRATGKQASAGYADTSPCDEDAEAYAALLGLKCEDWQELGLKPALSASEIRHFAQSHNAALSDIESAFLPGKFDLPAPLASFYIRHLTKARRDTEAALLVIQSSASSRLPRLVADAFAISSFEAAAEDPIRHEGNDYAASAVRDTSSYIDEAIGFAAQKLSLPADHRDHLLRLNLKDITEAASDIVERLRPQPFAFLLMAKELYIARCDVNRFPPSQRFLTALGEGDLQIDEVWVQRLAAAYDRLFRGSEAGSFPKPPERKAQILKFFRS